MAQALLLIVLLMVMSECSDISTVIAFQEGDVVLPCLNSGMDPKSCNRLVWKKSASYAGKAKAILAWPKTPEIQDAERVKWETDGSGSMSLYLTRIQKSDEGLYRCEIWKGWERILVKEFSLKVKDCYKQEVKAVNGTAIDLSCPVDTTGEQGSRNISWVMLKGRDLRPVNSTRARINGTLLAFLSVNQSDGGWYRCNYMLEQTLRCVDIKLHIHMKMKPTDIIPEVTTSEIHLKTRSSGALIAIVTSVMTLIAIIAASVALFIYCRCTKWRDAVQDQGCSAGAHTDSMATYEIVTLTHIEDPPNNPVNLYHQVQEEGLYTFQI